MLKNKDERKAYLLNDDNWSIVYYHPSVFTTIKQMVLPDGTIIIEESVLEFDEFDLHTAQFGSSQLVHKYRIVRSKYVTSLLSISFLIDYLKDVKQVAPETNEKEGL